MRSEPVLPVPHQTVLTLSCPEDYTNAGGDEAKCLYGQVVPYIKYNIPWYPNCGGGCEKFRTFNAVFSRIFKNISKLRTEK